MRLLVIFMLSWSAMTGEDQVLKATIKVPAEERLVLYEDYLDHMISKIDEFVQENGPELKNVPIVLKNKFWQRLAERLDTEFIASLTKPRFDPKPEDIDLIADFIACYESENGERRPGTPKPISNNELQYLDKDTARKKFFDRFLQYVNAARIDNVENFTLVNMSCDILTKELSEDAIALNLWTVKALFGQQFTRVTDMFIKSVQKVLKDFANDYESVKAMFFPNAKSIAIVDYSSTSGDEHKDTGNVAILTIEVTYNNESKEEKKIVYKPSSILIDWLIAGETKQFYTRDSKIKINQSNIDRLCNKFRNIMNKDKADHLGSLVELLSDPEMNGLKTYKILPIEDLNIDIPEDLFANAEKLHIDSQKKLDAEVKVRMEKAHGYLEFLDSPFTIPVDIYEVMDKLRVNPGIVLGEYYNQKLEKKIDEANAWFEEKDISNYWIKIGQWVELLYISSSVDVNGENFIAGSMDPPTKERVKEPFVIDFENSFDPRDPFRAVQIALGSRGGLNLQNSMSQSYIHAFFYSHNQKSMRYVSSVSIETYSQPKIKPHRA